MIYGSVVLVLVWLATMWACYRWGRSGCNKRLREQYDSEMRDGLRRSMVARYDALARALGWEFREGSPELGYLAGWYKIGGKKCADASAPTAAWRIANPFLSGCSTGTLTVTPGSPSPLGSWYGVKVTAKETSGPSAPATRDTRTARTPKRKRARGSSKGRGRK